MIDYIKGLFMPLRNRYYNGAKRSFFLYFFDNFFIVAFLVFLGFYSSWIFWLVALAYVLVAAVYYIYLDPQVDRFAWKYVWRHLYKPSNSAPTDENRLMIEYSKHPTAANEKALEEHFTKKH